MHFTVVVMVICDARRVLIICFIALFALFLAQPTNQKLQRYSPCPNVHTELYVGNKEIIFNNLNTPMLTLAFL